MSALMPRGMKLSLSLLAYVVCGASVLFAGERPAVSAREALDIAEKNLAERNLAQKLYVQSVTLERASILKSESFWMVKWSEAIPASNPANREIGIKVRMDGTATRLVKEPH